MATLNGFCDDRFESVAALLGASFDAGTDVGATVSIHHRGEVVCDLWGGHVDEARTVPWERDTIVNCWSTTKTMTFLIALMLADQGALDFDAPVSRYWPEFAANGKSGVLVRHLMSHSAGLSGMDVACEGEQIGDWEAVTSALAAQGPWWEPGTQSGYHALTQGHLIGEVVRRITGTTIGSYFAAEVAGPLGADFFIGLPESEESRVSIVISPEGEQVPRADDTSIQARTYFSPRIDATAPQHRWWRAAEIPAANGHGNARSLTAIQSVISGRGQSGGVRLVREQTVSKIFATQTDGTDLVLGLPMRFGLGYGLGSELLQIGPTACFWGGYGGSVIYMDQEHDLTVCYMMNLMRSGLVGDMRGFGIVFAAAEAAAL